MLLNLSVLTDPSTLGIESISNLMPDTIELDDECVRYNNTVLAANGFPVLTKETMLAHIRGKLLNDRTRLAPLIGLGSDQQQVLATVDIPAGSLLGIFYGQSVNNREARKSPIYKTYGHQPVASVNAACHIFPVDRENKLMKHAFLNHAYDDPEQHYEFDDTCESSVIRQANVGAIMLRVQYNKQPLYIEVFCVLANIKAGSPLLWNYGVKYWYNKTDVPKLFKIDGSIAEQGYTEKRYRICYLDWDMDLSYAAVYMLVKPKCVPKQKYFLLGSLLEQKLERLAEGDERKRLAALVDSLARDPKDLPLHEIDTVCQQLTNKLDEQQRASSSPRFFKVPSDIFCAPIYMLVLMLLLAYMYKIVNAHDTLATEMSLQR